MADGPVVVESSNSTALVILSLIAAGVIAFVLWFFVIDSDDQGDDVVPDITVSSVAG